MRVLVSALHHYPARLAGPSGGRVFDWLVKGLTELGHEVVYYLPQSASAPLPAGVRLVTQPVWDVDVVHCRRENGMLQEAVARGIPCVVTCHTDIQIWGFDRSQATPHWIYVSQALAKTYGSGRFVHNGIDPDELVYSATKDDYFLFVCGLQLAEKKGLCLALRVAQQMGVKLVVAGSHPDQTLVNNTARLCHSYGAEYVGEIWGRRKAEVFAHAKALVFPTQLNEAFGLVIAEALMSGTPVICSQHGACPELISPDVGFVCTNEADYRHAIEHVDTIAPDQCRRKALDEYHYLRMTRDYVNEYAKEMRREMQS